MKNANLFALLLCLIVVPWSAKAAITTYSSGLLSDNGAFAVGFKTALGTSYVVTEQITTETTVDLDTDNTILTYKEFTFSNAAFTGSFTENYTVGLGQSVDITTKLTIDSTFSTMGDPVGPLNLTPTSGGAFAIEDTSGTGFSSPMTQCATICKPETWYSVPVRISSQRQYRSSPARYGATSE